MIATTLSATTKKVGYSRYFKLQLQMSYHNNQLVEEVTISYFIVIFPHQEKFETKCEQTDLIALDERRLIEVHHQCIISTPYTNEKYEDRQKPLILAQMKIYQTKLERNSLDQLHHSQIKTTAFQPMNKNKSVKNHHPRTNPFQVLIIFCKYPILAQLKIHQTVNSINV